MSPAKPRIRPKAGPYHEQSEAPMRDAPERPEQDPPVFAEHDPGADQKQVERVVFHEDDRLR